MEPHSSARFSKPVFKKDQPDDSFKFQPLPLPTGQYPFHLSLEDVIDEVNPDQMVFHMVGDTGSIRNPAFQHLVVAQMLKQFEDKSVKEQPQFLYHLGDVVYNHGEAAHYYEQFFSGYQHYPRPIVAIAGNHDSDVNPFVPPYQSLQAFMQVFCDTTSRPVPFSKGATRLSMTQPNVYWTFKCPLVNIIGLHSNVPKYGIVTPEQQAWFKEELKRAESERPGKAIVVCIHHSPYSADINHGSSLPMIDFLEEAFEDTQVIPDAVFSGHVHSYQRFSKHYPNGKTVPFIVCGAGGYDELHAVALKKDDRFTDDLPEFEGVELENYCDDKHGFLKITVEKTDESPKITGEYFALTDDKSGGGRGIMLMDQFVV